MLTKVSIVVPVYNEEENILNFYSGLKKTLLNLKYSCDIIFVNDGSDDNSTILLGDIEKKDINAHIVKIDKRSGQHNAYLEGFGYAKGEIIVTIDADLQYDIQDLPRFLEKIDSGFDFVSGNRIVRKDSFVRKAISFIANRLISIKSGIRLHDYGCGFNAFKKDLVYSLKPNKYRNYLLLKPLLVTYAEAVGEINIQHYPRRTGDSKYNIFSIAKIGLDFLFKSN